MLGSSGGDLQRRSIGLADPIEPDRSVVGAELGGCGDIDWKIVAIALTLLPMRRLAQGTGCESVDGELVQTGRGRLSISVRPAISED